MEKGHSKQEMPLQRGGKVWKCVCGAEKSQATEVGEPGQGRCSRRGLRSLYFLYGSHRTHERWSLGSSFWQPWPREGRGQHLGRNQVSGGDAPKAAGTWTGQEEHLGARTTVRGPRLWPAQVLNAIPVLLHIPGLAAKVFPAQNALIALLKELAAEHRTAWDPARPPQDLTEAFLDKMEEVRGSCWGRGLGL